MGKEMTARVRMFGVLHSLRIERGLPTQVDVAVPGEGMSAKQIALDLELPLEPIEGVFCNHRVFPLSHTVHPGDEIAFVPEGTPGPHRFSLGLYSAGKSQEEGSD